MEPLSEKNCFPMAQLKSDTVVQVADALAQSIKSQSAALQADASATAGAEIDLSAMGSALKAVQAQLQQDEGAQRVLGLRGAVGNCLAALDAALSAGDQDAQLSAAQVL